MKAKSILAAAVAAVSAIGFSASPCLASPTRAQVEAENAPYVARGIAMEWYDDDDYANGRVPGNVEDRIIEPDSGCTMD